MKLPDGSIVESYIPPQYFLVDWDGDGLLDLVYKDGPVYKTDPAVALNIGTKQNRSSTHRLNSTATVSQPMTPSDTFTMASAIWTPTENQICSSAQNEEPTPSIATRR